MVKDQFWFGIVQCLSGQDIIAVDYGGNVVHGYSFRFPRIVVNNARIKELTRRISGRPSIHKINEIVDTVSWENKTLSRGIKIYLCKKYSGQKLKKIGTSFSIGAAGVCQASRRFEKRISQDKRLKTKVQKIENKVVMSRVKT